MEHYLTLKNVREQRRFDLADVASYTKISATSLSRFEAGEADPSTAQLRKLADAYGVKLYQLAAQAFPNLPSSPTDFRRSDPTPSKLRPAGFKRIIIAEKIANFSKQVAEAIEYKSAQWKNNYFKKSDTTSLAASIRSEFDAWCDNKIEKLEFNGLREAKIFGALRIFMETKGIIVQNNTAPSDEFMGFYLKGENNKFGITFVNREISSKKAQLFTLAHELAHALFNAPGISNPFIVKNNVERSCNKFAAEFLAPESEFRSIIEKASKPSRRSVDELVLYASNNTLLSRQASAMRLHETGYINSESLRIWFTKFARAPKLEKNEDVQEFQAYGVGHVKRVGEIGYLPVYLSALAFDKGFLDSLDIRHGIGLAESQQEKALRLAQRRFELALK